MRGRSLQAGYSLLEMLMYGAVLAIIVNLCTSLFLAGRRVYSTGETAIERIEALEKVEQDFRDSASVASERVDAVPGVRQVGPVLVLHEPAADGIDRYFTWRLGENGSLIHEIFQVSGRETTLMSQSGYSIFVRDARAIQQDDAPGVVGFVVDVDPVGTRNTIPASNQFISRLGGGFGP